MNRMMKNKNRLFAYLFGTFLLAGCGETEITHIGDPGEDALANDPNRREVVLGFQNNLALKQTGTRACHCHRCGKHNQHTRYLCFLVRLGRRTVHLSGTVLLPRRRLDAGRYGSHKDCSGYRRRQAACHTASAEGIVH